MSKRKSSNPVGRPTECDEVMTRIQVTLDSATTKTLKELGIGNLSLGIREAARIIRQARITKS